MMDQQQSETLRNEEPQKNMFQIPLQFKQYDIGLRVWLGFVGLPTILFSSLHINHFYLQTFSEQQIIGGSSLLYCIYVYSFVLDLESKPEKMQALFFSLSQICLITEIPFASFFFLLGFVLHIHYLVNKQIRTINFDDKCLCLALFLLSVILAKFDGFLDLQWHWLLLPNPIVTALLLFVMVKISWEYDSQGILSEYSWKRRIFMYSVLILLLLCFFSIFFVVTYWAYISADANWLISQVAKFNTAVFILMLVFLRQIHFSNFQRNSFQKQLIIRISQRTFTRKSNSIHVSLQIPREMPLCVLCGQRKTYNIDVDCMHATFCSKCLTRLRQKMFYKCPVCRKTCYDSYFTVAQHKLFQNRYMKLNFYPENVYRYFT